MIFALKIIPSSISYASPPNASIKQIPHYIYIVRPKTWTLKGQRKKHKYAIPAKKKKKIQQLRHMLHTHVPTVININSTKKKEKRNN